MNADDPRNCLGNPWPYDVIIDKTAGVEYRHALREARELCNACPLAMRCLFVENADEEWARVIREGAKKPSTLRAVCGTPAGSTAHYKTNETVCEPCRLAHNAAKRNRDNRKKAAA